VIEGNIKSKLLSNGLQLIGEPNKAQKSCALGYFVKTGARDEKPEENGLSHFLEHMMFKGTKSRSALDITFDLGNIGAQANAFTSEENTVYYAAIIPEYFSKMQELLSDMLRPALTEDDFNTEKNVILEEIALYQDRPNFYLFENASLDFFSGNPVGNSVLGSTESVSALTREQMLDYFKRRYSPSNMVLVASGDFDWDKFEEDATKLTESWSNIPATRNKLPLDKVGRGRIFKRKKLNQAHLLLLTPGISANSKHRAALNVFANIIGDGSGSKFYWELVDKGIAEGASADSDERDGCGVFSAYACAAPEALDKVSDIIKNILSSATNFDDSELERAKTKIASRIALGGELPMGRMMALGMEWNYRANIHRLENEIEAYKSITRKDVLDALDEINLKNLVEYRLLPE
jgi:predicted Zn-dependent peptidase